MSPAEAAGVTIRYEDADAGLHDLIDRQGAAIVTGVLGADDISELEAALQQDMEELVDGAAMAEADASVRAAWDCVLREGVRKWPAASLADVGARGRFQDRGMPHGRFAWKARAHPGVRRIYEILHQTPDLVSSCDNAFVASDSQAEAADNKYWPHVDQNDNETKFPCRDWDVYQGLLYVRGSESSHASTTAVWPGSHRGPYADYMSDPNVQSRIARGRPHFTLISGMRPGGARDRLIRGWEAHARRVPVPAGSLLLWTSRTSHQGWSGGPRLAQPLCWEPRARRDDAALERKLRLAALGLPSTHWASLGMPHELSGLARPAPASAAGAAEHDSVRLPLRPSIRSQALNPDADPEKLWESLQALAWFAPLPPDARRLLEASVRDEFKAFL